MVSVGGEVRAISGALVGALALDWLKHLRFDYAVIGASGLDEASGPLTTELEEAAVKKLAVERARIAILAADSGKLDERVDVAFAKWGDFQLWLADDDLSDDIAKRIQSKNKGLSLVRVS